MADDDKIRANRLRRMAARQGYRMEKSRRRDPRAMDYGLYRLVPKEGQKGKREREFPSIEALEKFLTS